MSPRLSIIPARAATDRALKPRDLQVLCVLGRHTDDLGWCRKSQVKMADEMGCARSTVFEAIERLVKAGYLERHVQESENGRDSPHVYRVVLDPVHPDPASVRDAEIEPEPAPETATPPAGISAPPAGPEPAPPAGPGPAPKNDPSGTTLSEPERESAGARDDRKRVERWLKRHHPRWPSYVNDSDWKALTAASDLTDDERTAAADRLDDYVASAKAGGRQTICAFSVYLAEKRWLKLPERPAHPISDYGPAFGPVWGAGRMTMLIDGPQNAAATEPATRWPTVTALDLNARMGRGHRFGKRFHAMKPLMEPVPLGTSTMAEWKAFFESMGWPWVPDPGDMRVVYFPAGGPAGLEAFKQAVRGIGNDADRQQAAE